MPEKTFNFLSIYHQGFCSACFRCLIARTKNSHCLWIFNMKICSGVKMFARSSQTQLRTLFLGFHNMRNEIWMVAFSCTFWSNCFLWCIHCQSYCFIEVSELLQQHYCSHRQIRYNKLDSTWKNNRINYNYFEKSTIFASSSPWRILIKWDFCRLL